MNNDEQIMQYITAIENPDSVGYSNGRWYFPTDRRKYDVNQIGIGLDRNNPEVQKILATGRNYLTEDEERRIRTNYVKGYLTNVFNKHTKGYSISPKKKAIAYGLLYNTFGPRLWRNENGLFDSLVNDNDEDFANKVEQFYRTFPKRDLNSRANLHKRFWQQHQNNQPSFNSSQYFIPLIQQTKPPYKPKTWQDYLNIPKDKLGGHLKPRLIPGKKHF